MENKQQTQFEKDLIESEQQFKEQFDPKSQNYHGGSTVPVPVGDNKKVPESMQGQMYPTNVDNTQAYIDQQQPTYFGPDYEKVVEERQKFLAFKKSLAKMQAQQETILRARDNFQKKQDEKLQETIKQEQKKLTELINVELLPLVEVLENSDFKDRYVGIRTMIDEAEKDFKDKTELGNWFLNYKKFGQYSFNDASQLMQKMKKLKKEYLDAQKNNTQEEEIKKEQ